MTAQPNRAQPATCAIRSCQQPAVVRGLCRSDYNRAVAAGQLRAGFIDATDTRAHVRRLLALGWTRTEIAAAGAVSTDTLRRILAGSSRVQIGTAARIRRIVPRRR